MSRFFLWLRSNAEQALVAAAQEDLLRKYRGPRASDAQRAPGGPNFFWRSIFVPVYRLLPWGVRRRIMQAMPGSHRGWSSPRRQRRPR